MSNAPTRYEVIQDGKDWLIIDTTTGQPPVTEGTALAGMPTQFKSRRGMPASSLHTRALNTCLHLNQSEARRLGQPLQ